MIFILQVLAVYGVSYVLTQTTGPFYLFYKARKKGWLPLHCFACTSVWASLVIALGASNYLLTALALIGAAIALHNITKGRDDSI